MTRSATAPVTVATLDELVEKRRYYAVLNAVLPILDKQPPPRAALAACKSYVGLGLMGPARELLTDPAGPLAALPDVAAILRQLDAAPSGQVEWATLRERFGRNLEKLLARHPHLCDHADRFESIPRRFDLFASVDDNLHVSPARSGGGGGGAGAGARRWHPAILDLNACAEAVPLAHKPGDLFCAAYLVTGDHLGALFRRIHAATATMFMTFTPRITLIEPEADAVGLLLWCAEDLDPWCHERVSIFAGPRCLPEFAAHIRGHIDQPTPGNCLWLPIAANDRAQQVVQVARELARERHEAQGAALTRARAHYGALPAGHWGRRFAEAATRPLRVLGMTSRFTTVLQYSTRDLEAAFKGLGHHTRVLIEPTDHDPPTGLAIARQIEEFQPDLVVVIDHHRRELIDRIPAEVPYVCWIQDRLPSMMSRAAGEALGELDFYVASPCGELVQTYGYPPDRRLTWTAATSEREYGAEPLPEPELHRHRCDFSFASNQSALPEDFHRRHWAPHAADPAAGRLAECLFEAIRRETVDTPDLACTTPAMHLLAEAQRAAGCTAASPQGADMLCRTYIRPLTELFFRQAALGWVADYCDARGLRFNLYGNGWEHHPRLARYHRGTARNGRELRAIYQASRINLQIIGTGSVHQRLLDGLAAGGFFLIRASPLDRVQDDCRTLLESIRRSGIEPGTPYPADQFPAAMAARKRLTPLLGVPPDPSGSGDFFLKHSEAGLLESMADDGYRSVAAAVFEDYDRVAFTTPDQFRQRADEFLADPAGRARTADSMHRVVLDTFTYTALVRDLIAFLADRLAAAPAHRG